MLSVYSSNDSLTFIARRHRKLGRNGDPRLTGLRSSDEVIVWRQLRKILLQRRRCRQQRPPFIGPTLPGMALD